MAVILSEEFAAEDIEVPFWASPPKSRPDSEEGRQSRENLENAIMAAHTEKRPDRE